MFDLAPPLRSRSGRTALVVSTQHWRSPFRIGSHHIAEEFARRGWRVAFVSAALSPLHLLPGVGAMKPVRWQSWRRGGEYDADTGVWHYVPFSLLPIAYARGLRQHWMVRNAWRFALPPIARVLRAAGFPTIDVALTDHFFHAQFFPSVEPRMTVYRAADITTDYPGGGNALAPLERRFARAADLVLATSVVVQAHMRSSCGVEALLLENGVELERFARPAARPPEYAALQGPIAVYVGAMDAWFDTPLLRLCAQRRPDVQFMLVGPPGDAAAALAGLPNVHLLGPRPHAALPAYLQHADVGLIPFRAVGSERFIAGINPLKAYEYIASGLPVVSTRLQSLPLSTAVRMADDHATFAQTLDATLLAPPAGVAANPAWDWRLRLVPLFDAIERRLASADA
ncbi:glycosyltransferase [Chiayiivirga flava]|uniref:Glycosyltransferase involved in cell wall biosynthesis n=1 Tax=Chiayiivirga flava TaxID=659595 RepID=A0A7W8D772_9GAMM|nr:glycosyltransferase [Chiayiivirga flava]MBB5209174.1 glycosyltransferase involved in cell wall biosynthesis [Chiayiivirga flava]